MREGENDLGTVLLEAVRDILQTVRIHIRTYLQTILCNPSIFGILFLNSNYLVIIHGRPRTWMLGLAWVVWI